MDRKRDISVFHERRSAMHYDHRAALIRDFLDEGRYTDFQLVTRDGSVFCHRLIMAAASPYIRQVLEQQPMNHTAEQHARSQGHSAGEMQPQSVRDEFAALHLNGPVDTGQRAVRPAERNPGSPTAINPGSPTKNPGSPTAINPRSPTTNPGLPTKNPGSPTSTVDQSPAMNPQQKTTTFPRFQPSSTPDKHPKPKIATHSQQQSSGISASCPGYYKPKPAPRKSPSPTSKSPPIPAPRPTVGTTPKSANTLSGPSASTSTAQQNSVSAASRSPNKAATFPRLQAVGSSAGPPSVSQQAFQLPTMHLPQYPKETVRAFVYYCYFGDILIRWEQVGDCIRLAEQFEMRELHQQLIRYAMVNTLSNNCLQMFLFARDSKDRVLLETSAQMIISQYFQEVVHSTTFLELNSNELLDLLKNGMNYMTSQNHEIRLKACVRWILHKLNQRRQYLSEILNIIDLRKCSVKYLNYLVTSHVTKLALTKDIIAKLRQEISSHQSGIRNGRSNNRSACVYILGGVSRYQLNERCWRLSLSGDSSNIACIPPKLLKHNTAICYVRGLGLVVAGGNNRVASKNPSTDCYIYNLCDDTWHELPGIPTPAEGATAVAIGHNVLILGGFDERGDVVESLDLDTNLWNCSHSPMLQKCVFPIVAVLNDIIYVLFNTTYENIKHGGYLVDLTSYNPRTNVWSTCQSLPDSAQNTEGTTLTPCDDSLYLIGGLDRLCMSFSPSQNLWTLWKQPRIALWKASAAFLSDRGTIVVLGGQRGEAGEAIMSNKMEMYHVNRDEWSERIANLPEPICKHCCFVGEEDEY